MGMNIYFFTGETFKRDVDLVTHLKPEGKPEDECFTFLPQYKYFRAGQSDIPASRLVIAATCWASGQEGDVFEFTYPEYQQFVKLGNPSHGYTIPDHHLRVGEEHLMLPVLSETGNYGRLAFVLEQTATETAL